MLFEGPDTLFIHNIPPRTIARCASTAPWAVARVGDVILITTRRRADKSALYRVIAADLTDDALRLYAMVCDRWALPEFAGRRWNPEQVADLLGTVRRLEKRLEAAKAELAPILLSFAPKT
jgi:hypothetical protein